MIVESRFFDYGGSYELRDVAPENKEAREALQVIEDDPRKLILSLEALGPTAALYLREESDTGCEQEVVALQFNKSQSEVLKELWDNFLEGHTGEASK